MATEMSEKPDSYFERMKLIKLGLLPKEAIKKKKVPLRNKSLKRQAEEAQEKELRVGGDSVFDKWFEERRKEMTGKCVFCGGKTEKKNDVTYRNSIAHLLPKRPTMFPSIATHPDNWLELCFYGNSCHTNFDNSTISWELLADSNEWKMIVNKFKLVYPFIAPEEHKNIPELLLKELK